MRRVIIGNRSRAAPVEPIAPRGPTEKLEQRPGSRFQPERSEA